jgi:hypothetical protein
MSSSDRKAAFFARTMHSPDTPERAALRAALRDVSKQLLGVHRALINAAKEDFAVATGAAPSPNELLQLLTDDPFFAWLKPMTSLIVEIDEMARTDFEPEAATAIGDRVARMFDPSAGELAAHYMVLLQQDVDVVAAHAALRAALGRLQKK